MKRFGIRPFLENFKINRQEVEKLVFMGNYK